MMMGEIAGANGHRAASQALRSVETRRHSYRIACSCGQWETEWASWNSVTAGFDEHLRAVTAALVAA